LEITPYIAALILFAAAVVGAFPPLYRRWSDRGLHAFVSVAAGIFLGSLFLHLLPELASGHQHGEAEHSAEPLGIAPWVALLAGFLTLFVVERVWLQSRQRKSDTHGLLASATLIGLGLHSFALGLGLGALHYPITFLIAIAAHKAAEAFSLATVLRLAHKERGKVLLYLGLFALITPVALLAGRGLSGADSMFSGVLTGFACGSIMYVAVCDLLPEVFHETERSWTKLGWVLLGVGLTSATLPQAEGSLEFVQLALMESAATYKEMALYLLFGFGVAGLLSQVLKPEVLTRHLARDDAASVAKASLVGAPLPLCSCSVVPVAVSLRKSGASKGATSAFLIATPETGVDSVSVTYALFDPLMTILRPLAAVISAFLTGSVVNWFVRRSPEETGDAPAAASCCGSAAPEPVESCCGTKAEAKAPSFLARSVRYGYVDMLDALAGLLIVGILLSGVIAAAIPASFFEQPVAQGFSGLVLMLLIGVPIYVCAAASTPIAATLLLKGLSPGAALVFLLASPATNLANLVTVSKSLGKRTVIVHVVTLAVVTLGMGVAVDALYPALGVTPHAAMGHEHSLWPEWVQVAAAIVLALLMVASLLRTRLDLPLGRPLSATPGV